jgi:hypothetical protein
MADLSKILGESLMEARALIELSQCQGVEFHRLSRNINEVNKMLVEKRLILEDFNIKNIMLVKLFNTAWSRKEEADANDCSRIAWLALHLNQQEKAHDMVIKGLQLDSENKYCQNLRERLEKQNRAI